MRLSISIGLFAVLLLVVVPGLASAAPDVTATTVINEDNGFPGVCDAPCFAVEKQADVYFDGNPTAPGVCPAGDNTYVYTLTHIGGNPLLPPNPPIILSVNKFELEADFSLVTSAGFIPGTGVAPSSTTVNPINVVTWDFLAPPLANGQSSELLFLCSPAPPGAIGDTMVSIDGPAALDAPGECLGPVANGCELEIDKTCCIPEPPIAAASVCDGKVLRAVFEVVGGDCTATTNQQDGKAKCSGDDPILNPLLDEVDIVITKDENKIAVNGIIGGTGPFSVGDSITFTNEEDAPAIKELKASIKFRVDGPNGSQALTIHTSCSKPLRCDDVFGSVKLVEIESTLGGTVVCTPPGAPLVTKCVAPSVPTGTECDSRLTEATFEFNASDCQSPLANPQGGKAKCNGDASDGSVPVSVLYTGKDPDKISVIPSSGINNGDKFRLAATGKKDFHPNTKLVIMDADSVEQSLEIHTSCSQPLSCGDVFGSLTLTAFKTKDGQDIECDTTPDPLPLFADACTVPLTPPTPHCTSKIRQLTLVYLGDEFGSDCSVTNGQEGKASCSGDNLTDGDVSITITKDASTVSAEDDSGIPILGLFDITRDDGSSDLASSTEFTATDGLGNTQQIVIHTSCSKNLNLGDRFGDFAVFALDRKDDGVVSLGGEVEYQYKVTNLNASTVVNVSVDDIPFGNVVSGETLTPGEMKTFFITKTLFGSLTNQGTVSGELESGAECTMDLDTVDVAVTLPPAGPFDCKDAKPIKLLGMIWDGTQDIRVKAYKGAVGSQLLKDQDGIMPGDEFQVGGLIGAPNDVFWEIFAAGTSTKLGESKFHLSCSDSSMNGVEDCGRNEGDGKDDDAGLINDWLLERIRGVDDTLNCTPDPIVVGSGGSCGIGFELILLVPPLVWLHRRRRQRRG